MSITQAPTEASVTQPSLALKTLWIKTPHTYIIVIFTSQSHWGCLLRRIWPRMSWPLHDRGPALGTAGTSHVVASSDTSVQCTLQRQQWERNLNFLGKRSSRELAPYIDHWDDIWCSVRCYRSLSSQNPSFLHTLQILFSCPWLVLLHSDTKPWDSVCNSRITWSNRKEGNHITIPNNKKEKKVIKIVTSYL